MTLIKKILLITLILLCIKCREKYVAQLNEPVTGYLVVEGFINSGAGATTINLSHVTKISDINTIARETKANVRVEGRVNTSGFLLTEISAGTYSNPQLTLVPGDQYRVHIKTSGGKEYVSDYSDIRSTTDIDSVTWAPEKAGQGVNIYVNTHDAQNKTKYHLFKYEETWEFHSTYATNLKVYNDRLGQPNHVGYRDSTNPGYDFGLYKCWQSNNSSDILLSSTENLTQDVVSAFPLLNIAPASWKLGVLYSVNVKHYALSQNGYRFFEQLRKNTQQLGSIFDAQPSDNYGNMHSVTNPTEVVIGFVEVSEEKQKRLFINAQQVPAWNYKYNNQCDSQVSVPNIPDSILSFTISSFLPTTIALPGRTGIDRVFFVMQDCVDCRLRGTNVKPAFWP